MSATSSAARGLDLFEIKSLVQPGQPFPGGWSTRGLLERLEHAGVSRDLVRLMIDRDLTETTIALAADAGISASDVEGLIGPDGTVDEVTLRTMASLFG